MCGSESGSKHSLICKSEIESESESEGEGESESDSTSLSLPPACLRHRDVVFGGDDSDFGVGERASKHSPVRL